MERITDPVFRNEYGECEKERLEKRMERVKEIEERLRKGRYDRQTVVGRDEIATVDIEYLLAENKRLRRYHHRVINQANHNNCHWCGDTIKKISEKALKQE